MSWSRSTGPRRIRNMPKCSRTRVAIIGGGCASIAAAWELTHPELDERFDVTVYQMGWRLGGKGASGRGPGGRIEEHGLHLWMGHYDNAFRMMRECYAELNRDSRRCPVATWHDAFKPDHLVGLTNARLDGSWSRLMATFPGLPGEPGDGQQHSLPGSVLDYVSRCIRLLMALLEAAGDMSFANAEKRPEESVEEALRRYLRYGRVVTLSGTLQALHTLQALLHVLPGAPDNLVQSFVDAVCDATHSLLEPLLRKDSEAQVTFEIADIMIAIVRGALRFGLLTDPRGLDAIDDYDAREWLALNGASRRALDSAFLRGLYDLAFAYEDGDPHKPGMAAGQAIRGGLRMFLGYHGALFWKMQAGMGDIVFAPLYEVLRRRGVRFEFFHRLENVSLSHDDKDPHVESLEFNVQAGMVRGDEYQPLIDVKGLPCWPSQPMWDQLEDGARLRDEGVNFESAWDDTSAGSRTLRVGRDFDFVVLGVGLGAIPMVCSEIVKSNDAWATMVTRVKTVSTQAFQLWMDADLEELGWEGRGPSMSAFVEPFDTWADMTHLLDAENMADPPASIAYFCNVLPTPPVNRELLKDTAYPTRMKKKVRKNAIRFLNREIEHLWPDAVDENGFRWKLLNQQSGAARQTSKAFGSQFWTANVGPSDLYVQSLPGTIKYRISPLDETYDNLTIAGDWTDCGFNFGCVEAAVISGRLASHALSEYPPLKEITGYDHP